VIGIVGGVASGKSTVADCFRQLGGLVIDGDQVGHQVLRRPEVVAALRDRWGDGILDAAGQISRRTVAQRVFEPTARGREDLAYLESLVHPKIGDEIRQRARAGRTDPAVAMVIVDAAVLFETGWDRLCDHVLFIDTPADERRRRARQRGWTDDQFDRREAAQWPVDTKRSRADSVLPNLGSAAETCQNVRRWCEQHPELLARRQPGENSS
jgi:dephospho-CoA kinase